MKVLVITAAFPPMRAAEADHMFHLCHRLAERGVEIHVVTTRTNRITAELPFKVHPVIRDWSWPDLFLLKNFLKHISPDAVLLKYIGFIYNDHPMITFVPTLAKSLKPSMVFVTQFSNVEGAHPEKMSVLTRSIRKIAAQWAGARDLDYHFGSLLRDSDRVIVLSDVHRRWLAELFPAVNEKSRLIPPPPIMKMSVEDHGSTRQKGRDKLGLQANEFLLVYFGYMYPGKGIETLLRAFRITALKYPHARLLILGGFVTKKIPQYARYREEIKEIPKQLGIENNVIWFGEYAWDSDEASMFLRAADAGVIPMDYGVQLNNSAFAALIAHGLPVITTRGLQLETAFVHETNVLLCAPKDPKGLAEAITRLIENPEIVQRLKVGAAALCERWFSWEKAVEHTVATFNNNIARL